jgi:membrane protease YdiL (CAAX protease family)
MGHPFSDRNVLTVAGLSVALFLYSSVTHLIPGYNVVYVPLSLGATLLLAAVATGIGLTPSDLGLERASTTSGLRWGAGATLLAALAIGIAVLVPSFHGLFDDARVNDMSLGLLAYRALVRIPFGTALLEELAFRGVLFGAWQRIARPLTAALGSSVVFGLWHVRPTVDLLEANELAVSAGSRIGTVVAAAAATTVAGLVFCWLRIRSRSLLAPYLAHTAINSFALGGAFIVAG